MTAPLLLDRIGRLMDQIEYRVVDGEADLMAVGRLRYEAYRHEQLIRPTSDEIFIDGHDHDPNAVTFMALVNGKLAGSIRLHFVFRAEQRCPAMRVFSDILAPLVEQQQTIVDPSRLAVHPAIDRSAGMVYALLRLPIMASYYYNIDFGTATVKSDHRAFYSRIMRSRQTGEPRAFLQSPNPIYLMLSNLREERDRIVARYPFFDFRHDQEAQMFDRLAVQRTADRPRGHRVSLPSSGEIAAMVAGPLHDVSGAAARTLC